MNSLPEACAACSPLAAILVLTAAAVVPPAAAAEDGSRVYIGTYTGKKSQGIYAGRFNADKGGLSSPELVAKIANPTFLALAPDGKVLYSVAETSDRAQGQGGVAAYKIQPGTGALTLLNEQPSGGSGPCHVALEPKGKCVLVANYGSGSVAAFPVLPEGSLGPAGTVIQHRGSSVNPQRQKGPHGHFIQTDKTGRYALTCDLGLDKVLVYTLDATKAALIENDPPSAPVKPGAGPRHLVFAPNGRLVYVINELDSTITSFRYDPKRGTLEEFQTVSTLPADFKGANSTAEIQVHPSGKFIYGSNRGHDSIAIFSVVPGTGMLKSVDFQSTGGKTPRHFALDPSGKWLLAENQDSDNIVVFRIDSRSGRLSRVGEPVEVGSPVCIVFAGK